MAEQTYSKEQIELAHKTENGYMVPVIRGIQAFDTTSKYWAWWGYHTVDGKAAKRKRGEHINWNPKMRTLGWKIGKQFVLQGDRYRTYYDLEKQRLNATRLPIGVCPRYAECVKTLKRRKKPACKGHIDAMARRKTLKMFLSHLYETWRKMEGLPTRPPYVLAYLGHTTKDEPITTTKVEYPVEPTFAEIIELRRLVDVLYDIQDVRMRVANRLRVMPKDSVKIYSGSLISLEEQLTKEITGLLAKFPIYTEFLYNVKGIGPRISGSIIAQTMIRFEKISIAEYKELSQTDK